MPTLLSQSDEAHVLELARAQPETAGELTEFLQRLKEKVVEVTLGDERIRERLAGVRYRVLTADYREDKLAEGDQVPRLAEIGIYDYERDVLVVAVVDLRTGAVAELLEREGVVPPIAPEELEEARQIAAGIQPVGSVLATVAFPTPSYAFDQRPDARRHRGCVLYGKGPGGETWSVVIDLSGRQVFPDQELPEILRTHGGSGVGNRSGSSEEG